MGIEPMTTRFLVVVLTTKLLGRKRPPRPKPKGSGQPTRTRGPMANGRAVEGAWGQSGVRAPSRRRRGRPRRVGVRLQEGIEIFATQLFRATNASANPRRTPSRTGRTATVSTGVRQERSGTRSSDGGNKSTGTGTASDRGTAATDPPPSTATSASGVANDEHNNNNTTEQSMITSIRRTASTGTVHPIGNGRRSSREHDPASHP